MLDVFGLAETAGLIFFFTGMAYSRAYYCNSKGILAFASFSIVLFGSLMAEKHPALWPLEHMLAILALVIILLPVLRFFSTGIIFLVAGGGLNFLVIALNGFTMPFASRAINLQVIPLHYAPITQDTLLPFLADIIPFSGHLMSIGDIYILLGIYISAVLLFWGKKSS